MNGMRTVAWMVAVVLLLTGGLLAGEGRRRADRNRDGKVGPKEREKAKEVRKERREVDTKREEKFDKNEDGTIGRRETEKMREAAEEKRAVDTKREEKFDKNEDGTIGRREAKKMREARERREAKTEE